MSDDNLVQLTIVEGGGDDDPVTRRRKGYCGHRRSELDEDSRRVYCRECGEELDPFTVLQKLAGEPERWHGYVERAKAEAKRAEAELADLKRQLRNAKARARRAG